MSSFLEEVSDQLNMRWAWDKVRREALPGDIWFDSIDLARIDLRLDENLESIAAAFRTGKYKLGRLRPLPFPKHPSKAGEVRIRQAFQVPIRDQIAWAAVVNVVGQYVESRMPTWSYGNRLHRSMWLEDN